MECDKKFCGKGTNVVIYHLPIGNLPLELNISEMNQDHMNSSNQRIANQRRINRINNNSNNQRTINSSKFTSKNTNGSDRRYDIRQTKSNQTDNRRPRKVNWSNNNNNEINSLVQSEVKLTISPMAETSKIRLVLALEKLQEVGIEYSLLSQYFKNMLEQLMSKYPQHRTLAYTLQEMLVFDKQELRNSSSCYMDALSQIRKSSYINFSVVYDMVIGLSEILRDLK